MTVIELPTLCLVVLVGASGAGKSTFAHKHFAQTEVLSSDVFRGLVADDPRDQSATADAFGALLDIADRRLRRGLLTVVDATSVRPEDRKVLLDLAKERDVFAVAVVLDVGLSDLQRRAENRPDIDPGVIGRQHRLLHQYGKNLRKEGFRFVHTLDGIDAIDQAQVVRTRLFNDRTDEHGPFDIIGDVHGCARELCALLAALGWTVRRSQAGDFLGVDAHPDGRRGIFVGDLVDRGPDTPEVLRIAMSMTAHGQAFCVRGNHEEKLLRALRQRRLRSATTEQAARHGLAESLEQLDAESPEFVADVIDFIDGLVSHYVFDDGRLVISHAGLAQRYHGRTSGRVRNLAMYGETTGETDRWGYPVRLDWARDYRGDARVVYGHTPVPVPEWINNTLCVDTGCVFGGRLSALRYPENDVIGVSAGEKYWPSERPMGYGDSDADERVRSRLRLDDVVAGDKRLISTRFGPSVTVRGDRAASALEVMSRFAADPRWLRYLPPTMSPVGTQRADLLEDPDPAFAYYAQAGVDTVLCEEKHMGSRAVVAVTRDARAARRGFGIDGPGALYTRTGRMFFDDETTAGLLLRARTAASELFDALDCEWVILDAELLPWNIKGQQLIRDNYANLAAAASVELDVYAAELDTAATRGLDVGDLRGSVRGERADIDAFSSAYSRYVTPGAGIDDVRIAPFEVLAAGGGESVPRTFECESHLWHLDVADRLVRADPSLFAPTARQLVTTTDASSCRAGARWWSEITTDGAEGMVVKPLANMVRDKKNRLVLPGVKVRGEEYLRIIYGPGYRHDLDRLRSRDLRHKRSMAMREYQLGREALARHVDGAPLWRVHECVFCVLALESEPVDTRL